MALRAKACVRESDTVARLGGDEFLAVLPTVGGLEEAQGLAQRLVDAMNQPLRCVMARFKLVAVLAQPCIQTMPSRWTC
ncbi:MAG: diguanylate cyclase [Betaproteobacteria bacterium]|nr:diguanylate cyclase [Betaproteobacteria bacterium]